MGNSTNYVLFIASMYLVFGMIAISVMAIDPDSQLLLGNKLFGTNNAGSFDEGTQDNVVIGNINMSGGAYSYAWNNTVYDSLGGTNSLVETSTFKVPDWIKSGWTWATGIGRTYVNFVGAPYTIVSFMGLDSDLSALIGSFFGIFGTFVMLNWLLGRDN